MRLRERLPVWLRPPYQLKTILLVALSTLAVLMIGLNALISYQRIQRETLITARQQATSIASLVAKENLEAMVIKDIGSIESSLQQVSQLPDVDTIAIARADGRLISTARQGVSRIYAYGWKLDVPKGSEGQWAQGAVRDEQLTYWAPIAVAQGSPIGWVKLDYNLAQRRLEVQRLWHNSVDALLLTLVLILVILPLLLESVLKPIRRVARVAGELSSHMGRQIHIQTVVREAQLLADALNQASQDLSTQAARTHIIVNTAAVAIIGLDAQARVVSANPATTSLFGREEDELIGRGVESCVPGLIESELHTLFGDDEDSATSVARVIRQDFLGTRRDGTLFPIEVALGRVSRNDGLRYACIIRDVTDERAAQESSELYERALASSHNGVFITHTAQDSQPIIFVNEAFQRITGLQARDVLGRDVKCLARGRDHARWMIELRQAVKEKRGAQITIHDELVEGRRVAAEVSLSPVHAPSGQLTHYVGIVSDVTDRVRAEEAIAKRSAQLNAVFSLSPDGFVLLDAQGDLLFANPAFERMTGRSWRASEGRLSFEDFRRSFADMCRPGDALPSFDLQGEEETQWQSRIILARPQHRVLQVNARRNLAGRSETILYFRDVTHEDEVDRMKSEFLASAAHELRTPMVSILGFTELLIRREFSPERRLDMLQTIHRQSGLLVKMINELLDLARIESRRGLDMKIEAHALTDMVEQCVHGLMRAENERQVQVAPVPPVHVLVDPEKFQLALNNLLSNAFKYSPDGGEVTLSIRLEQAQDQRYVVLDVQDQGIGMRPDQVERAFERFYRADTTGNIPGTGLGLSLVKEIAELHGGRVELSSAFGAGTKASLWIPQAEPSHQSARAVSRATEDETSAALAA